MSDIWDEIISMIEDERATAAPSPPASKDWLDLLAPESVDPLYDRVQTAKSTPEAETHSVVHAIPRVQEAPGRPRAPPLPRRAQATDGTSTVVHAIPRIERRRNTAASSSNDNADRVRRLYEDILKKSCDRSQIAPYLVGKRLSVGRARKLAMEQNIPLPDYELATQIAFDDWHRHRNLFVVPTACFRFDNTILRDGMCRTERCSTCFALRVKMTMTDPETIRQCVETLPNQIDHRGL